MDYDVRGQEEIDFFTGGITIMDYGFIFRPEAKLKHLHDEFVFIQDVNWWTGVLWIIVMFLSAVWTLILTAPIHCRGTICEQVM